MRTAMAWVVFGAGLAASLVFGAASGLAQDRAGAVKARQDFMEQQQHDFDAIAAYAKGNGDQATAVGKVNDLISRAPKIPDQFVAGTSSTDFPGVSRAKPELWQNMDKVKALAAALLANEQKLLAAVKSGDNQAIMDQLVVTFRNGCGACHTDYRAPKT